MVDLHCTELEFILYLSEGILTLNAGLKQLVIRSCLSSLFPSELNSEFCCPALKSNRVLNSHSSWQLPFHLCVQCLLRSLSPSAGTNSTNAVSGSEGLGQSQGGSQCLAPNMSAPHQRKGTFTDDLHKLVDNWARDAMNLSQVGSGHVFDTSNVALCPGQNELLGGLIVLENCQVGFFFLHNCVGITLFFW